MTNERASVFQFRAWRNRLLVLLFNVPALPYVAIRFPRKLKKYARNVGTALLTGRGGL